jgi:hypothetical protein
MRLQTLLDNYGHYRPDYLSGPRDALDGRRPEKRASIGKSRG